MNYDDYDMVYTYKDYILVNELYEDDRFTKNQYQWARRGKDLKPLKGLSSNSYASATEAITVFKKMVEVDLKKE